MHYQQLVDFDGIDMGIFDFFLLEELQPDVSTLVKGLLLDGFDDQLSLFQHAVTVNDLCC